MPTDACLFFWTCPTCGVRVKPNAGDCCVFCSYGTVPCPPVQLSKRCCEGKARMRADAADQEDVRDPGR